MCAPSAGGGAQQGAVLTQVPTDPAAYPRNADGSLRQRTPAEARLLIERAARDAKTMYAHSDERQNAPHATMEPIKLENPNTQQWVEGMIESDPDRYWMWGGNKGPSGKGPGNTSSIQGRDDKSGSRRGVAKRGSQRSPRVAGKSKSGGNGFMATDTGRQTLLGGN